MYTVRKLQSVEQLHRMTFNKSWGDGGRSVIMGTILPSLILHPLYPLLVGRCYLSIIVPEGTPFCCDTLPQQMWAVRFVAEPLNSWQRHFHKNLCTWANPNFHQVYPYIDLYRLTRTFSLAVSTTFGDFILSQELWRLNLEKCARREFLQWSSLYTHICTQLTFYGFHVPDPVWFCCGCCLTIYKQVVCFKVCVEAE